MLIRKVKFVYISIILIGLAWCLIRIHASIGGYVEKQTRFMMDTFVSIHAIGQRDITSEAVDRAFDRMQEIDRKFNPYNKESPLYAFNHKGVPITDKEILDVVKIALDVCRQSDGAFDITTFSLTELWGFNTDVPQLPDRQQIKQTLGKVNYRNILIGDRGIEKAQKGVRIGLGAIAKGYAVNEAVKVLKNEGVDSAIIDAGGDIYALGRKGKEFWKVGIKNPKDEGILGYLEVEDMAVMASGDYERFFINENKKYHHIFNPKTGYPAQGLTSVTVICSSPILADAWATAVFVLGKDKGLDIVEKLSGIDAIIVTTDGQVLCSSGANGTIILQ